MRKADQESDAPQDERGLARTTTAFVALGGNLGNREENLVAAARALSAHAAISLIEVSPVFETDAVGPGRQPAYLNAALRIETSLSAHELLSVLQGVELALGRDRSRAAVRWGARVIDLDLLFWGEEQIDTDSLTVPHPRLHEREFVMRPLAELAPEFRHPVLGEKLATIAARVRRQSEAAGEVGARPWPDPPGWRRAD